MLRTLDDLFAPSSHQNDRKAALVTPRGTTFTYADCRRLILKFQQKIELSPSDSAELPPAVSMLFPNCIDLVIAFLGLATLNVAANPLNPKYGYEEIKFYLNDAKSQAVIIPKSAADDHPAIKVAMELGASVWRLELDEYAKSIDLTKIYSGKHSSAIRKVPTDPQATALILHTSGTTSKPKGVPLTHGNICKTIQNIVSTYRLTPEDRTLVVMPLFHVHGLIGALLSTLASRGSAVIMPFTASEFWDTFQRLDCSWYSAVPTIHQILLKREAKVGQVRRIGRLRFIRSCSAPLPPPVLHQLEATYGVPVLEAYAMTEAAHQMTSNPLPPKKRKPGSVGLPQGVEIKIHDGEVCVRGSNVTSGYLNRPEANSECFIEGGWFRTGDQGFIDKEGYLFLTGRLKELINRGGEKISPLEIDNALLSYPGVAEAVAFGEPDPIYGEVVCAAVVLREDAGKVTEAALKAHCLSKLAKFKCPTKIYITKQVPKTATGKIQRRIVAAHFQNKSKL